MTFGETVLAAVLGTSISALLAWVAVQGYRRWRSRRKVWRVRLVGHELYGVKYIGRRPIWNAMIIPQGPGASSRPMPLSFQAGASPIEEQLKLSGAGGWWHLSWEDRRGHWATRILVHEGLEPWTVAPEAFFPRGSSTVREVL